MAEDRWQMAEGRWQKTDGGFGVFGIKKPSVA